jgi:hypothetical protein
VALIWGFTPNASGLAMLGFEKINMLDEQVSVVFKKAKRVSFVIFVVNPQIKATMWADECRFRNSVKFHIP